jgi:hypothetical protein
VRYVRHSHIIFARNDDGELALYHPETNAFFTLNAVGEWIWDELEEAISSTSLAGKLAVKYALSSSEAEQDVADFLDALLERSLVTVRNVV